MLLFHSAGILMHGCYMLKLWLHRLDAPGWLTESFGIRGLSTPALAVGVGLGEYSVGS